MPDPTQPSEAALDRIADAAIEFYSRWSDGMENNAPNFTRSALKLMLRPALDAALAAERAQRGDVATRDREWSASLETGYSDCPPRTPNKVAPWWKRLHDDVSRVAVAAEMERLAHRSGADVRTLAAKIRAEIVACDEIIGPDGACRCSHTVIALVFAERTDRERPHAKDCKLFPVAGGFAGCTCWKGVTDRERALVEAAAHAVNVLGLEDSIELLDRALAAYPPPEGE